MSNMFSNLKNLILLNLKNLVIESGTTVVNMFSGSNQSMIYCINKDNIIDDVTTQLLDFPNLYCSELVI